MQVLLISSLYPPILGGAELQAQSLARELDSLGVRITVLTRSCKGAETQERDRGIEIFRTLRALPIGPLWGLTYMLSTHHWLRRLAAKWDLIHSQQIALHSCPTVRVARALCKPCLVRTSSFGQGGDLATLNAHRFGPHLVRELRGAARIIAQTAAGVEEIIRYQLPAERVRIIPNGVDLQRFCVQPWPNKTAAHPIRLLFVGRLSPQKGLDVLLDALSSMQSKAQFTLRIVGTGSL